MSTSADGASVERYERDDPVEMAAHLIELAKDPLIANLVEARLPNSDDDLRTICAKGYASLRADPTIAVLVHRQ